MSGLHLPSFSTNLVSTDALQDAMVTTTTPWGQLVSICMCTRTGRHLATFTRRPGSSLYTLTTEPPQVVASAQVSASGPVAPPCSYRLLSHQTLLWHHRLGHPSLPRLRGMHSCLLVSGLPRSLPPLPPSPAPPCLPCVEGRQRAAPHSSSFTPTTAPLQTLHMAMWGPARASRQGHKRYFLLVIEDYTRYTTVFPLRSEGEVPDVLIPWICAVRHQLRERFCEDLPVPRLHYDRGGEFSSDLLREFCLGEGILQSLRPETSPTLRWTGKVGDASVFRVWGSRAFVRDTSAEKLSSCAIPCVFLGFTHDAPGWQFYHPTSRRLLPSQYATFDESVPFIERRESDSRPASPVRAVCTGRRVPRPRPPSIPCTQVMALRPSSVPLRVPLPSPHASSLPEFPDPEFDLACVASPTVPRLLATIVSDPLIKSAAALALVAELVDFAAACRFDYATSLVAESESNCPSSVGGECALSTDVLEDRQEDFECLAAAVPHPVSMMLAHEGDPDAPDIPTPRSSRCLLTSRKPSLHSWVSTTERSTHP
ncbi:unnamed protein product [Closterium sp. NIES-54]